MFPSKVPPPLQIPAAHIEQMEAGWVLDCLVHNHFFGILGEPLHSYSASWLGMQRIAERFRRGFRHTQVAAVIEFRYTDGFGPDSECRIFSPTLQEVTAVATELPLAVCRATLLAVLKAQEYEARLSKTYPDSYPPPPDVKEIDLT